MPPKKPKNGADIRKYFNRSFDSPSRSGSEAPVGVTSLQVCTPAKVNIKDEQETKGCDWTEVHTHHFKVKVSPNDTKEYTVQCDHPQTVLQAIKSHMRVEKLACDDDKIVIQLGNSADAPAVATQLPCCVITHSETLVINANQSDKVERLRDENDTWILPRSNYSVFLISTKRERPASTKKLFFSNRMKKYDFLCICGEKGSTIEETLRKDGRFVDDLGPFQLSDFNNKDLITKSTEKVDGLNSFDGPDKISWRKFQIRLPRNNRESGENVPCGEKAAALRMITEKRVSAKEALEKPGANCDEIHRLLKEQSPWLREWMEKNFPDDSYQSKLQLKKENFGKLQQSFSETYKQELMVSRAKSVCKLVVGDICTGTGFVLFDNYIMTNAHLFGKHVEERTLQEDIRVLAVFNYVVPFPETDCYYFTANNIFVDIDFDLDYAILELKPEPCKCSAQSKLTSTNVPPGLLSRFGTIPKSGEACIVGHFKGEVKRSDFTWLIEKDKREQAVEEHLYPFKDYIFTLESIRKHLQQQGIADILLGGAKADQIATYHTFMYHGASGSPVFDSRGQVFGLHTAGCTYGFKSENNVIEYAGSLLMVFAKFVENLKERKDQELLEKVSKIAEKNPTLKKIMNYPEPDALVEVMDQN